MSIVLTPLVAAGADHEPLVAFLTSTVFPFHVHARQTRERAEAAIDEGAWGDDDNATFWLDDDEHGRVGVLRLEDLTEHAPLFDLRLGEPFRGLGLAAPALRAATAHVFDTMPAVTRFEGQTRQDNVAMRRTFRGCGWVQEACYREAWPVEGGAPLASVAYGILRRDWETGETTPVDWDA